MELKTKKILLVIAFLGSIFLFGFLLYFFFFKGAPEVITSVNEPIEPGDFTQAGANVNIPIGTLNTNRRLPPSGININVAPEEKPSPIALGGLTKVDSVTDTPTQDSTISSNGRDVAYYNPNDNFFYKVGAGGKIQKISDKRFFNVEKTYWADDINKAIIEYPDKTKIMYDFEQEEQFSIPQHWESFDFSPDGKQIVTKSIGIDPDTRWLAVSNADGSQATRIEALGERSERFEPSWSPTNKIVATYTESRTLNRQEVFFIGKNKENFKSAVIEGRGFESTWSPTGSHLLYSVYNSESGYRPTLWITEATGERIGYGRKPLELNTWAHKCTFSSSTKVYCAVPTSLEEGSGLFPEISNTTPDHLYEINLSTGSKRLLAIPEQDTSMKNIMVDQNGRYIFYTDTASGKIFKINLK